MIRARWRSLLLLATLVTVAACSPSTPEELHAAASDALDAGDARTAEIYLKNLLQREPNDVEARRLLGEISLTLGDAAAAEHNLQLALELGVDQSRVKVAMLRALLAQNKFARAVEIGGAPPVLAGGDQAAALSLLGAAQRGLGRLDLAEQAFEAALAIDPTSALIRTELAAVYFQAGRIVDARTAVDTVLASNERFVPALLVLGSLESAAARNVEARAVFERVLGLEGERKSGRYYGVALAQLAEVDLAARDVAAASARADELLALIPGAPIAQYLKARVEIEQANLASAERRLETLIATVPDYWPAYVLLGVINANQNQLGQAEMYLRRAASSNARDARSQLLLAEVYLRQSNVAGAREVIDESAATTSGVFLALAGRASLEAGQVDLAAEYFARSEENAPSTLRELIDVSSIYVGAGELERAVRVLEAASLREPDSDRLANYLLTLVQLRRGNLTAADATARRLTDPRPESLNLRATIALLGKDLSRARELYEEALAQQPDYLPALLNLARVAGAEGKPDEAAAHLRRALEINPNHVNAVFGLVQLAAQRGDFAEAETWLARAPESALRSQLAGDIQYAQQRFADAVADYRTAFGVLPSVDLALRILAAGGKAGSPDAAETLLSWSEANPNDARANFAVASLALQKGDNDTAVDRYERVLSAEPSHFGALNNLAWLYGERRDERALGLAERAFAAQPRDPSIMDTLGWIHVSLGEPARGLPLLQQATDAAPAHPEIRYHYAVALADTGDSRAAAAVLTDLLAREADFPSRARARGRLAELRTGPSP